MIKVDFSGNFPWFRLIFCCQDPDPADQNETDPQHWFHQLIKHPITVYMTLTWNMIRFYEALYNHTHSKKFTTSFFLHALKDWTMVLSFKTGNLRWWVRCLKFESCLILERVRNSTFYPFPPPS